MSEDCFCTGVGCTECCFGPLAGNDSSTCENVTSSHDGRRIFLSPPVQLKTSIEEIYFIAKYIKEQAIKVDDSKEKVSVTLVIPDIKKPRLFGLFNKTDVQCHFESSSLRVLVRIHGKKSKQTPKYYLYAVRKLPASIVPSLCHYRIRAGRVKLTLRKAEPTSWREIIENGLEKDDDQ